MLTDAGFWYKRANERRRITSSSVFGLKTSTAMLKLVIAAVLCVFTQAQQYQNYGGQPQQQQYIPQSTRGPNHPPAPVHYVNIGQQLQGDYKFGYDTGKGPLGQSFREETRLPDGSVKGAYGYLDEQGRQRVVKYTAGKAGFSAEGDVGPHGAPKAVAPGPAPQPVQPVHQAPAQAYRPPPQQQYNPPAYSAPAQQRPSPQYNQYQEEDYNQGPAYIDTSLLSYNIGRSG